MGQEAKEALRVQEQRVRPQRARQRVQQPARVVHTRVGGEAAQHLRVGSVVGNHPAELALRSYRPG